MDIDVIAKAVLHVHSDWSYDGKWTLSRIAEFFSKLGYRLVFTNEHDATFDNERWKRYKDACHAASTDKILLIPGMEYSDETNIVHVLVWGVEAFLGKQQPTSTILQKANDLGGFCVMAHPSRRQAWRQIDTAWLPLLHGLELWNRKADGIAPSSEAIDLLKINANLKPFVGLDFHRSNQLFPLSMKIKIKGSWSRETVFHSLHDGNCKSTALGLPATYFENKIIFSCLNAAEYFRGAIAAQLKRLRNKS